ncbi:hypothetical protein J4401_07540 [Candidatus Woesearchaeota archaeon]|nr:hypothetical protein [Candidatus Woesearchaeota archaeon]
MGFKDWIKGIYQDKFARYLILVLIVIGIIMSYGWQPPEPINPEVKAEKREISTVINLPFFGEIDAKDYSLAALAMILGLVDGFNPCAMWVLVYLISMIMGMNDKRKIWLIVGSFLLASGTLYFLFMTAWLNVFLFIGYLRPVTLAIGLFAIGVGINDLKKYFTTKGNLVCDIGDQKSKGKTMDKIKQIVSSPITLSSIAGIIVLAFAVNSIEFVCSSGIPAVFTQVLASSSLEAWQHYAYILLYDLFFMLDDLIIFGLAVFAVNSNLGEKYARHCKLIGGAILLILGLIMVFNPALLA